MEKFCPTCKAIKDVSDFHRNKARYDGLSSICKICKSYAKKSYKLKNRDKISAQRRQYEERNGTQAKKYLKIKERMNLDLSFRLKVLLRGRLSKAVVGNAKSGSAVSDLGCSIQHLKLHLELFWDEGMSWTNYGNGVGKWNIDHIVPLTNFDLSDRGQFLEANNYLNLQPLWYLDNISKSNRVAKGAVIRIKQ